jgi:hypothetical protein
MRRCGAFVQKPRAVQKPATRASKWKRWGRPIVGGSLLVWLGHTANVIEVGDFVSKFIKPGQPTPQVALDRPAPSIPKAIPIDPKAIPTNPKLPAPYNLRIVPVVAGPPERQSPAPPPVWKASAE